MNNNIIIIPTLNPNENLIKLIMELHNLHLNKIMVIDDGSSSQEIFNKIDKDCIIIHHDHNLGKGMAMKTGVKEAPKYFHNIKGYVFCDSDLQHSPCDILQVANKLEEEDKIVFGVRDFNNKNVPFKSKFGNKFSSIFFKLTTGIKLKDTQTGLRGIPVKYQEAFLNIKGDRYDLEMNFLYYMADKHLEFIEVPIKTIYIDNNSGSYFRPLQDAFLIYKEPLKFIISSLTSAMVDIISFIILNIIISNVFFTNILARLISGVYNYNLNKHWCFNKHEGSQALPYFLLFVCQMFVSSCLLKLFSLIFSSTVILKLIIDFILFIVNYVIEKRIIFKKEGDIHEKLSLL